MNKEKLWDRSPILSGGLLFGITSLIINVLSVALLGMAHVFDIVHIFPVLGLLAVLPNEPNVQWPLALIALVVDVLIGCVAGAVMKKMKRKDGSYLAIMILLMLIYHIAICYQWLPII